MDRFDFWKISSFSELNNINKVHNQLVNNFPEESGITEIYVIHLCKT